MPTWNISTKKDLLSIDQNHPTILTTINSDIYRILRNEPDLYEILLKNKISIDGRPLYYILKLLHPNIELVQGSSFIFDAAKKSAASGVPILILGGSKLANQAATNRLTKDYGCKTYGLSPDVIDDTTLQQVIDIIVSHNIGFVFICLGAPKQERFAIELQSRLPPLTNVLLIGAGGTVDFAANHFQRAPKFIQKLGLEGIYRLLAEPSKKRLLRIITSAHGLTLFTYDLIAEKIEIKSIFKS